jgi:serine/threonine-protein kinase
VTDRALPDHDVAASSRAIDDVPPSDDDQRLAQRLAQLSERAALGESIDVEQEAAALGPLGDELRQLWGAVMLANALGSDSSSVTHVTTDSRSSPPLELPYRFGDYELIEEVGRGGMGVVYRARQLSLGRVVAVKMLLRGRWASINDQARFRTEAESAARLDHPNIVPVYEVGEHGGHSFFSMKFVAGQTLSDRLKSGPMPPREAATLLTSVCRAIDFAHRRGVLHRDLKPSNIVIDDRGQPHVMDFGLAKQVADTVSLTRTGAVLGTPAYMAPEQAAGNRGAVGVTSDVYSLGTILYHMITGHPPFEANSPMEIVLKVLEQDPPLPRTVHPKVDRDLEMITLRCLQKPPDLRYESAEALADDLQAYLNDEPIMARSGRFSQVIARLFRETHHATILENWGVLWMWHSLVLIVICLLTNAMYWAGDRSRVHYFLLWTAGLGAWAAVFWALRRRMGPVTFVERQIAHVWAASVICIAMLFPVEYLLSLPVLKLSPILALATGMVFLVKAGILSGSFYLQAAALFATSVPMARWPNYSHVWFGIVSAACFFFPGWKYYRQRLDGTRGSSPQSIDPLSPRVSAGPIE